MSTMKYVSLFLLMTQATTVIFVTRMARANAKEMYLLSSVTVYSEFIKLAVSLFVVFLNNNFNPKTTYNMLVNTIVKRPLETFLVGVPAILYTVQNNLIAYGMSNLPGAVFQIMNQLKIIFTAVLSILILKKVITVNQWVALTLLFTGVVLIQLPSSSSSSSSLELSPVFVTAMICVVVASVTSGIAGVWFEKVLKSSDVPISVRNIQLSFIGWTLALAGAYMVDGDKIRAHPDGLLQNYTSWAWGSVLGNAIGGLLVSLVIKYADNVLKGFANAASIVITCTFSFFVLKEAEPTKLFVLGTGLVCLAVYLYGTDSSVLDLIGLKDAAKVAPKVASVLEGNEKVEKQA